MPKPHRASAAIVFLVLVGFALAGCSGRPLAATPYIMRGDAGREQYNRVPEARQTPDIPVFYVTDRTIDRETETGPVYGTSRSSTMSYGVATVSLKPRPTWEELVDASVTGDRARSYGLEVSRVEERGQIAPLGERYEIVDGRFAAGQKELEQLESDVGAMVDEIVAMMEPEDHGEVAVFVHGFHNTFDDAVTRLAQCWHLAGRKGVPIAYTWPAGYKGFAPIAYSHDRESGEFTIVHLKGLLWALARDERIRKVHLIAHSRGTDVALTALREVNGQIRTGMGRSVWNTSNLGIEAGAPAEHVYEVLKLENVVLAAPDIDVSVFAQRFFGENLLDASRRFVIYFSRSDFAIAVADLLFASERRLGRLRPEDIKEPLRSRLAQTPDLELIDVDVKAVSSHAYLADHPGALSDLIRVLRDGDRPGAEHGRPLGRPDGLVWRLDEEYLRPADHGAPESPWPYAGP